MIRQLRWNDMDDLIANYYSYYDELSEYPELGLIFRNERPDFESEVKWFSGLYAEVIRGDALAMIAEEDGHAVGICDVHRMRPGSEVSHVGVLGIAIKKGCRDRGIGGSLMSQVLEESRGKFEIIRLGVFSTNQRAIVLYRKLGFKEYGVLPGAIRRGNTYFDEIQMYRNIEP